MLEKWFRLVRGATLALHVLFAAALIVWASYELRPSEEAAPEKTAGNKPVRWVGLKLQREPTAYQLLTRYIELYSAAKTPANAPPRLALSVVDSNGSFDTLTIMDEPNAPPSIGVVQADVLYHYVHGNHPQFPNARSSSKVRAVSTLFAEWLEVWSPEESQASPNADASLAAPRSVCAEPMGSGSLVTMLNVNKVFAEPWEILYDCQHARGDGQYGPPTHEQAAVRSAYSLRVRAPGSTTEEYGRKLIGLSSASARLIKSAFPSSYDFVSSEKLKNSKAPWQTLAKQGDRHTISTNAVLVATGDVNLRMLDQIQDALTASCTTRCSASDELCRIAQELERATQLCQLAVARSGQRPYFSTDGLPISAHPAVLKAQLKPPSRAVARFFDFEWLQITLGTLAILSLAVSAMPKVSAVFEDPNASVIKVLDALKSSIRSAWHPLLLFFEFHLLIATLVWLSEYHSDSLQVNNEFVGGGLSSAFCWLRDHLIMGEDEIEFQSNWAKFWMAVLKLGWGMGSVVLGLRLAGAAARWARERKMVDHIIIVGKNAGSAAIERDLKNQKREFRSLRPSETPPTRDNSNLEVALMEASIVAASAVIVLADETEAEAQGIKEVDLWVCQTVARISAFTAKKPVRIIAEVVDSANEHVAARSGAHEVVCVRIFGAQLVAHSVKKRGVIDVFRELLWTGESTNEVYVDNVTLDAATTFGRVCDAYREHCPERLVIGYRKADGKTAINPPRSTRLPQGKVELICIAMEVSPRPVALSLRDPSAAGG